MRRNRFRQAINTVHNANASAALAQAITLARKGKTDRLPDQRDGRIDVRRLTRAACGDSRIFIKRGNPAPDKVRVTILLDASGSMGGTRAQQCTQIARDLAGATEMLPWVKADIVAFTTRGDECAMFPLWKSGEPTDQVDAYGDIPMSGTEEGYAIAFARDEMLEHLTGKREQALIIIVSDGAPSEAGHVKAMVEMCKRDRIPVVSVALVKSANQPLMYGKDNVVMFDGNTRRLARDMAKVMGRVI